MALGTGVPADWRCDGADHQVRVARVPRVPRVADWPTGRLVLPVHQMMNDLRTKLLFAASSPHIERPYRLQDPCVLLVHMIQ